MNPYLITAVVFCVALSIGFFIGKLIAAANANTETSSLNEKLLSANSQLELMRQQQQSERSNIEKSIERHLSDISNLRAEKDALAIQLTKKEADYANLYEKHREQKSEIEQLQEKFTKEFENLANRILDEKSLKFTEQNKTNLTNILSPLQEKIQLFEKKVEDTHKESIGHHSSLKEYISGLQQLNVKISQETLNLTKALKGDSKMQGNWGELILERVLEKSGLEKGREYDVQQSFINEDGQRIFPDVTINLPEGKKMIVDSKVSLVAYERFINEEDDLLRAAHLKEHVASIKRHVEQLGDKNYHTVLNESPDFVLLFIPIEPAFAIALAEDNTLYNKAFAKNVVIVTPTTLLATLRTIDSMWTNRKKQENAIEIARQASALYDKFVGVINDLLQVGRKISDSQKSYEDAMKKLSTGDGNIVRSIEKIRKLGLTTKKDLPDNLLERAHQESVENNLLEE